MKLFRRTGRAGSHAGARPRRTGAWRLALAAGVILGGGSLLTWASFTDSARLNLGGQGIGSASKFDIALVGENSTVQQADGEDGLNWPIAGAESFVPGRTLTTSVTVFNNSPTFLGELSVAVEPVGDGQVGTSPNITQFLAFSAFDATTGNPLFGDPGAPEKGVALADAQAIVGDLTARGGTALDAGAKYTPGNDGSAKKITVLVHYKDVPETAQYNGGQSALNVKFDAQSK